MRERHIARCFPRHEIDRQALGWRPGERGYPSNGRIAWGGATASPRRVLDRVGRTRRRDPESARQRALEAERYAHELARGIGAGARHAPRAWNAVADAYEVAIDAWLEAGDEDRARNAEVLLHNILVVLRYAYRPVEDPEREKDRYRRAQWFRTLSAERERRRVSGRGRRDPDAAQRALEAERHAAGLTLRVGAPARGSPATWSDVADAYEVAADAWFEAGNAERARNALAFRDNIRAALRYARQPLERSYRVVVSDGGGKADVWKFKKKPEARSFAAEMWNSDYRQIAILSITPEGEVVRRERFRPDD